jgi:hypothetical protein
MLSAIQVYVSVAWLVICYTLIYQVYILWDIYHMLACDTLSCHCEDSFMFVKKKKKGRHRNRAPQVHDFLHYIPYMS